MEYKDPVMGVGGLMMPVLFQNGLLPDDSTFYVDNRELMGKLWVQLKRPMGYTKTRVGSTGPK